LARALDWLCRSAEAGWKNSQAQLLALADDRALARSVWRAPAARRRRRSPGARPSILKPGARAGRR
jgi:hypothetical protein